eukprot:TRINITY_DN17392_c0_g3_i1.p1 TRINITY_DN17392_c0_g3~~TRINITY_DN17392_c0_g3_i1.p1  ORF type:complete len:303 (-),score=59.07 TRINITY_DN17392_c0_g3_i1:638-1546(-)
MDTSYVDKGEDLLSKGRKNRDAGVFGRLLGGKSLDASIEYFQNAANTFKMGNAWEKAGEAYKELAETHKKDGNQHEAANSYADAAKMYAKALSPDSAQCFMKAAQIYMDNGKFNMAGRQLREAADWEDKNDRKDESAQLFRQAAKFFDMENMSSEYNKCMLRAAEVDAQMERYQEAQDVFEEVGKKYTENNLLKYGARDVLLNAGLCILARGDLDAAEKAFEKYKDWDVQLEGSRQGSLMEDILSAVKANSISEFENTVQEFDSMSRLEGVRLKLLLDIKNKLGSIADGGQPDIGEEDIDIT